MIYIDNSMISDFRACKQRFLEKWIMNRQGIYASIHQVFGGAVHKGVERLWWGDPWTVALTKAQERMRGEIHPGDLKRWEELKDALPDCIAVYADSVDVSEPPIQNEQQFDIVEPFGLSGITLTGRIDRVHKIAGIVATGSTGPVSREVGSVSSFAVRLVDLKTASEIDSENVFGKKVGWENSYKERMLLDGGIGIYDFALRQMGFDPQQIIFEVILKPYPRFKKEAKLIHIHVPEIMAYRERHDMTLRMTLIEMRDYIAEYRDIYPWPMTASACESRFGGYCEFAAGCRYGYGPKINKLYRAREEHLDLKGGRING